MINMANKECYDNEMNRIKLGSKITDGEIEHKVERIHGRLSISIDGEIIPVERLCHDKLNTHAVVVHDYTVVK